MSKHLTITVGDVTLFAGDVAEITFTDNDYGVKVEGLLKRAQVGGGLLDILTAATKPKREEPAPNE